MLVAHRRKRDATRSRNPACGEMREPCPRPRSFHQELGEARRLHEADAVADSQHFLADMGPCVGATERDVLDGPWLGSKPQRHLEAVSISEDGTRRTLRFVDRGRGQRPAFGQELVGEADAEAPPVVLSHLGGRVGASCPVAESGDVHGPHVESGIARGHPVRQGEPDTPALGQSRHHPAGRPQPRQAADGADEGVAIGGERERPIDHPGDAGVGQHRKVLERRVQRRCDPLEVRGQQALVEVPWRLPALPCHGRLLVRADQQTLTLLARVDLAAEVDGTHQLGAGALVVGDDLVNGLGDDVGVLHGEHRQLEPDHAAHLACPQPSRVDDMGRFQPVVALGGWVRCASEIASGRVVQPDAPRLAVRRPLDASRPGVATDLCARCHRRPGVREGHAGRIDVAVHVVVHRSGELAGIDDRHEPGGFFGGDHLGRDAEVLAACVGHPQPVEALGRVGQEDRAGEVDAAVLA